MNKLKEGKISANGLFYVLVLLITSKIFIGIPRAMVDEGGAAAWLLILTSAIVATVGVFFLVKLLQRFPGQNLVEIGATVWGRPGAILVSLFLFLFFMHIAATGIREFSESILITVLPRTPISVIIFFFIASMAIGAYNGLEVITRANVLLFPFVIGGIVSILLFTGNFINLNNLFPLLGSGPGELLYHAPGRSSIFLDIIIAGLLASSVHNPEKIPGQIWKAFSISAIIFVVVELFYVAVLRVPAAERLYVPLFQLARLIYLGRFVQRIEVLYIFVWLFSGGLMLTIALYGAATVLARGFKISIYQPLVFPLSLLIFALSFVPADVVTAVNLDLGMLREYGALLWGLPAALFITAAWRGKGGSQGGKQKQN